MINLVWLSLLSVLWLISSTVTAGEVLYQRYFGGDVQKPALFEETITLPLGKAPYLLNLVNGNPEGDYRLSSITLVVNGTPIIGPKDLNTQTEAVNRPLTVLETNQLTLTVRGPTEGFVQVTILGETVTPEPTKRLNFTQDNSDGSLMGLNMGGHIVIWFEGVENTSTYMLYVAPTPTGPWQAIQQIRPISLLMNTVDNEGEETTDTGEPRQEIGDTTYYKMEAQDAQGKVLKNYSVLTVPPYVEEEPLVLPGLSSPKPAQVPPASCQSQSPSTAVPDPCRSPCLQNQAFISDAEFVNSDAMALQNIRDAGLGNLVPSLLVGETTEFLAGSAD